MPRWGYRRRYRSRNGRYRYRRFYGRGAYGTAGEIGGAIGGALGSQIGLGSLGSRLGSLGARRLAAFAARRLSGRGEYNDNQLISGGSNQTPIVGTAGDETGSIRFQRREYVGDVIGTSGFNCEQYPINPGIAKTFDMLSQLAANFDEYEIESLVFEYVSVVPESSASVANAGTFMMAAQYNPASQPFRSKSELMEYAYAVNTKVSENCTLGVECDPRKRSGPAALYVRQGAVPVGQDIKTFDFAVLNVATINCNPGSQIGELWASYSIVLKKPKLWGVFGYDVPFDAFFNGSGFTTSTLLGTQSTAQQSPNNILGGSFAPVSDPQSYIFPLSAHGYYRITAIWKGSGMSGNFNYTLTNCTGTTTAVFPSSSAVSAIQSGTYIFIADVFVSDNISTNAKITFSVGTFGGTQSSVTFLVEQRNGLAGDVNASYVDVP